MDKLFLVGIIAMISSLICFALAFRNADDGYPLRFLAMAIRGLILLTIGLGFAFAYLSTN